MLAPDDAALAARDPGVPGLRLLLDPDAVADALATAFPELPVTHVSASYVRYKPATSALVAYRITLADGSCADASARTSARPGDPKLGKVVAAARRQASGEPACALVDSRTVVLLTPHDHDLPALARLAAPGLRSSLLARALDADPVDGWTLTRLRYKPERRWVGKLTHPENPPLLVKVQRPEVARRAAANARALETCAAATARLRGLSRRHGLTVHEWVDGPCVADLLRRGATPAAAEVGSLLAALHAVDDPRVPARLQPAPDEGVALTAAVDAIRALDPAAGDRAAAIAGAVHVDQPRAGRSVLHGDCSVDQVVLTGDGPVLIDLDRAAVGDLHSDLAQLLADLAVRAQQGQLQSDGEVGGAVLDAYVAAGGAVDRERLARTTAARLLRLAPEPFRQRRPGWRDELDEILFRAASALGGQAAA